MAATQSAVTATATHSTASVASSALSTAGTASQQQEQRQVEPEAEQTLCFVCISDFSCSKGFPLSLWQ
ncbi:hypothetical protein MTO96_035771 [Rhipicephalus appendiculatus]